MSLDNVELSFEFFPPKSEEGVKKLNTTHQALSLHDPEFFSVTYGAGGSTQETTIKTVVDLNQKGISTAPHISCVGATEEKIHELLTFYKENDVKRLVALRGDMPSGMGGGAGRFTYAADLVAFIQHHYPNQFHIDVAAYPEVHPQARDCDADLYNFINKVESGADSAITQYFYNADSYLYFRDRVIKAGCDVKISPGIMPIINFGNLLRFSDACGSEIPRWIQKKMEGFRDDTGSIKSFGHEVVTSLCQRLLSEGVDSLHFYTMNQSEPSTRIIKEL